MKIVAPKNQKGAVLAVSLFMLLLLTLVSTSMIRQNKTQIAIAANAGQQTQAFATVESALAEVQHQMDEIRYNGTPNAAFLTANNHCHASAGAYQIDQGANITAIYNALPSITQVSGTTITATVYNESCISGYAHGSGSQYQCYYVDSSLTTLQNGLSGGTRNVSYPSTASTYPSGINNQAACLKLNQAGPYNATTNPLGWRPGVPGAGCQVEAYTLNVSFQDLTGASRTVQSQFLIDCSSDINFCTNSSATPPFNIGTNPNAPNTNQPGQICI